MARALVRAMSTLAGFSSAAARSVANGRVVRMDKTIRKYTSLEEMNADECRYWQSRPVHERLAAVSELTEERAPR